MGEPPPTGSCLPPRSCWNTFRRCPILRHQNCALRSRNNRLSPPEGQRFIVPQRAGCVTGGQAHCRPEHDADRSFRRFWVIAAMSASVAHAVRSPLEAPTAAISARMTSVLVIFIFVLARMYILTRELSILAEAGRSDRHIYRCNQNDTARFICAMTFPSVM